MLPLVKPRTAVSNEEKERPIPNNSTHERKSLRTVRRGAGKSTLLRKGDSPGVTCNQGTTELKPIKNVLESKRGEEESWVT